VGQPIGSVLQCSSQVQRHDSTCLRIIDYAVQRFFKYREWSRSLFQSIFVAFPHHRGVPAMVAASEPSNDLPV
jgi:hypothetical protein